MRQRFRGGLPGCCGAAFCHLDDVVLNVGFLNQSSRGFCPGGSFADRGSYFPCNSGSSCPQEPCFGRAHVSTFGEVVRAEVVAAVQLLSCEPPPGLAFWRNSAIRHTFRPLGSGKLLLSCFFQSCGTTKQRSMPCVLFLGSSTF